MSKLIENKKKRQQKCYKTTTDTTKKKATNPICFTQFEQILLYSIWANPNRWTEMEMGENEKMRNSDIQSPWRYMRVWLIMQYCNDNMHLLHLPLSINMLKINRNTLISDDCGVYVCAVVHIHTMTNGNYITQLEI